MWKLIVQVGFLQELVFVALGVFEESLKTSTENLSYVIKRLLAKEEGRNFKLKEYEMIFDDVTYKHFHISEHEIIMKIPTQAEKKLYMSKYQMKISMLLL